MMETKTRESLVFSPLEDEPASENLPEPISLTPEQLAAQAEADERDRQRQLEWAMVVQALNDNSLAVVRAMRRFRNEAEQQQVERVLTSHENGSFLIDRLVALHRGFDELIVAGTQGWQRFGIDQHLDAPGYAGLASDQRVAFEREHHLVN